MKVKPELTISVVNYNAGDFLIQCLQSIEQVTDEARIHTVVVDNASTDGSFEHVKKQFKKVQCIQTGSNLGFGKAHNIVLKDLKTDYVLILNPDTTLEKGVLSTVLSYMEENKSIGAATCKIVLPDGSIDLTAHRGFPTPEAAFRYYFLKDDSLYHLSKVDMQSPHEVDALSGSFMLTRKAVLDEVGLFDEDYFMYAEDIDLCYRIKQAGHTIMYLPQVQITHYKGVSTGIKKHSQELTKASLETRQKMTDYFYDTMQIYYRKHYQNKYPFWVNWLVFAGIRLKWWMAKQKLTV